MGRKTRFLAALCLRSRQARRASDDLLERVEHLRDRLGVVDLLAECLPRTNEREGSGRLARRRNESAELLQRLEGVATGDYHLGDATRLTLETSQAGVERRLLVARGPSLPDLRRAHLR